MKKTLTLKNMVETYVNYPADQREMDKLWDAYYQMYCVGFIDAVTWDKFSNLCHGWFFDEDCCRRMSPPYKEAPGIRSKQQ